MKFDIFVMILCGFVMVTLVAFFSVLIANIIKLRVQIIEAGLLDDELKKEVSSKKKENKAVFIIFKLILPILFCIFIGIAFVFSLYVKTHENSCTTNLCVPKVVKSDSMAYRHEKNKYLEFNNLTNQFQRFDIIFLDPMPKQENLNIYDIVAYEINGVIVIHRIVGKQEKDGETLYLLRGDANLYNDYQYVKYSQMRGIYTGKRVAFVGSVVLFLQSPAGWMCIVMCAFVSIILPLVDRKILKTVNKRMALIEKQNLFDNEIKQDLVTTKFANKKILEKTDSKSSEKGKDTKQEEDINEHVNDLRIKENKESEKQEKNFIPKKRETHDDNK